MKLRQKRPTASIPSRCSLTQLRVPERKSEKSDRRVITTTVLNRFFRWFSIEMLMVFRRNSSSTSTLQMYQYTSTLVHYTTTTTTTTRKSEKIGKTPRSRKGVAVVISPTSSNLLRTFMPRAPRIGLVCLGLLAWGAPVSSPGTMTPGSSPGSRESRGKKRPPLYDFL